MAQNGLAKVGLFLSTGGLNPFPSALSLLPPPSLPPSEKREEEEWEGGTLKEVLTLFEG